MPERILRPSFSVVTGVITTLVLLAFASRALEDRVPPPPANRLGGSTQAFLIQGSRQPVDWREYSTDVFAQARRESKLVLVLIGNPWSTLGRRLDAEVFTDPDVARYLSRNYLCVRIDATVQRRWTSAFLPYTRMVSGLLPGLQIWVMDPEGNAIDLIARNRAGMSTAPQDLLSALIESVNRFSALQRAPSGASPPGELLPGDVQREDLVLLRSPQAQGQADLIGYADALSAAIDPRYGGFPINGIQPLLPQALKFGFLMGREEQAAASLNPVLFSPLTDVLDGGFFRLARVANRRMIEYDKIATLNAEMVSTLAFAYAVTGRESYRLMAERSFDGLISTFSDGNLVVASRPGEIGPNQRSERFSFGGARLRRLLSPADQFWARDNLGLDPWPNSQMTPFVMREDLLTQDRSRLDRILTVFRRSNKPLDSRGDDLGQTEVQATVAARMIEAAGRLRDPERLDRALNLLIPVERLTGMDGVRESVWDTDLSDYLGDHLSVADAILADYLATGRMVALDVGVRILRRALRRFQGEVPGEYLAAMPLGTSLGPRSIEVPELADHVVESCQARVIRLAFAYGAILGDTPAGREFTAQAFQGSEAYGGVMTSAGPFAAGYFNASWQLRFNTYAVAVGPNSDSEARSVAAKAPFALVFVAAGDVRKDLQRRSAGVYVVSTEGILGPLSSSEAAATLVRLAPRA